MKLVSIIHLTHPPLSMYALLYSTRPVCFSLGFLSPSCVHVSPDHVVFPVVSLSFMSSLSGSRAELRVYLEADHGAPFAAGLRLPSHARTLDSDASATDTCSPGESRQGHEVGRLSIFFRLYFIS